ncbi:hypothetical protein ILUMI_02033 [Ignelater luminosus]|uniref:HIG1 domain-containing protein n=1 Tax=Ignelater luminosus TaxID=2038154 RepID=A0A8K0DHA1_IGNLU|nr:hypothetical protein ILUMI_02033 [Ignelater luminosus]
MSTETSEEPLELDWLALHNEFEAMHKTESMAEKFQRKVLENPFVPIGCLATLGALSYGLWSFRQGRSKMSQYMMRTRIAAQGFTIMAFIVGLGLSASKAK